MVVNEFTSFRIFSVTFSFKTKWTNHLRVTTNTTFTDVYVSTFNFKWRKRFNLRYFFNIRLNSHCRNNFHCTSNCNYDKRSEEHTSELQSRPHLVCRLLLEKKK